MQDDDVSLNDRFLTFLDALPGCESIDRDVSQAALGKDRRGDYLLRGRSIVVEVKSLEQDTEHKIEARLREHRTRPEFPLFYWPSQLSHVLAHLPDGEQIEREIHEAVTTPIKSAIENANRQVAATKRSLALPDAAGVLILLNERIGVLAPEVIAAQVSRMLNKRTGDRRLRYRELRCVLLVTESHSLSGAPGGELLPVLTLLGPEASSAPWVAEALDGVAAAWATSQGRPLLRPARVGPLRDLDFRRRDRKPASPRRIPVRHEVWRADYRAEPYLRPLPDAEFAAVGKEVLRAVAETVRSGAPRPPEAEMGRLWSAWTHVLQEAESRGFDMKRLIGVRTRKCSECPARANG